MSKEKILDLLRNSGDFISGQKLAAELGVSRNTIWKYIKALQDEGYEIKSQTNRGYRLDKTTGQLSLPEIIRYSGLNPERFIFLKEVNSTNSYVKEHHETLGSGMAVVTDYQTGGRGRYGRSFYSPAGEGLYLSIIYKGNSMPDPEFLTIATALAVSDVLSVYGLDPAIKWVNDVFVKGKKLCGILTEGEVELESGSMKYLVLGIGLNINNDSFPEELRELATSMKMSAGKTFDLNEVAACIIASVDKYTDQLVRYGKPDAIYRQKTAQLVKAFNDKLLYKGETITLSGGNRDDLTGTLLGTDEHGHLLIETKDGIQSATYGEYHLMKPPAKPNRPK